MENQESINAAVMDFGKKFEYFLAKNPGFGINIVTTLLHTKQGVGSQSMIQVCKLIEEPPKKQLLHVPQ